MKHYVYDAILARRSIRQFSNKTVEKEKIKLLLETAMAAPSACNLQPWAFIVIDDSNTLEKIRSIATNGDYYAPLSIVVCGVYKHIPWDGDGWIQDCGGAAQNMMIEAVELGLGSVCIGGFDEDKLKEILDIPIDVQPLCIIDFGYPQSNKVPLSWYTEEAIHWQKFDNNKERKMRTLQMLQDDIKSGLL